MLHKWSSMQLGPFSSVMESIYSMCNSDCSFGKESVGSPSQALHHAEFVFKSALGVCYTISDS